MATDLSPEALAAQAQELSTHAGSPCSKCADKIAAALGAVCDVTRQQERDLKCAWDSRACEAHQPLYAEQEECPFCHAVKLAEDVRQLREALTGLRRHDPEGWWGCFCAETLRSGQLHTTSCITAEKALAATEPSHG